MLYKLESLRGIAALIIVIVHTPFLVGNEDLTYLELAVDFFFILSGMVMALSYQNRIKNGLQLNHYELLRLGRLYPLHLFTLFLILFLECSRIGLNMSEGFHSNNSLNSFLSNIFLIQSIGVYDSLNWNFPSWSISTEFFAYILFYFLLISFDRKHKLLIPLVISIICYFFLISLDGVTIAYTFDYGIIRCVGGFYLGVFIYRLKIIFGLKLKSRINFYELIALSLPILLIVFSFEEFSKYYELLFIASFGLIIFVFSEKKNGVLGTILNFDLFKRVGKYSYSIYLLHIFVVEIFILIFKLLLKINPESIRGFYAVVLNIIICLVAIFLSKYSYKYIEIYFRDKSKAYVGKRIKL